MTKKLRPDQRDSVNMLIREFPFPTGVPKICFGTCSFFFFFFCPSFLPGLSSLNNSDITSTYRNFSMSLMQQVSSALPYIFLLLGVKSDLIKFWATLNDLIQRLFSPKQTLVKVRAIRLEFLSLLQNVRAHPFHPFPP